MNTLNIKRPIKYRTMIIFLFILFIAVTMEFPVLETPTIVRVKEAEAVVGRPASPNSVAGVHRRTRRRAHRRHRVIVGTRLYVLPGGCVSVWRHGILFHHCHGVYYRPYYEGTTVVYVVVEEPEED